MSASSSEEDSDEVASEEEDPSALFSVQLGIVDQSFGPKSDLYRDVLGVKPNATPEQIQRAYFQRRNELFQLLADMGGGRDTPHSSSSSRSSSDEGDDLLETEDEYDLNNATASRNRSTRRTAAAKRLNAERKMDAVVMAMRVLGDPELRTRYDDVRTDRLRGRLSPIRPMQSFHQHQQHLHSETIRVEPSTKSKKKSSLSFKSKNQQPVSTKRRQSNRNASSSLPQRSLSSKNTSVSPSMSVRHKMNKKESRVVTPEMPSSRKSPKTSLFSFSKKSNSHTVTNRGLRMDCDDRELDMSDNDDTTLDNHTFTDEGTLLSETSDGTRLTTRKKGFVQRVADEVMGAIEDTTASFDQVFNVFTLQEEDIRAVRYRIDKVRRQIEHSM